MINSASMQGAWTLRFSLPGERFRYETHLKTLKKESSAYCIHSADHLSLLMLSRILIARPLARLYATMAAPKTQQAAVSLLDFINSSPSPFHAVRTAKEHLSKAGFQEIKVNCSLPATVLFSG
jgi:hypothetical protein